MNEAGLCRSEHLNMIDSGNNETTRVMYDGEGPVGAVREWTRARHRLPRGPGPFPSTTSLWTPLTDCEITFIAAFVRSGAIDRFFRESRHCSGGSTTCHPSFPHRERDLNRRVISREIMFGKLFLIRFSGAFPGSISIFNLIFWKNYFQALLRHFAPLLSVEVGSKNIFLRRLISWRYLVPVHTWEVLPSLGRDLLP